MKLEERDTCRLAAPQASSFNTKSTKDAKSTSPFAILGIFVLKESSCGAHPLSRQRSPVGLYRRPKRRSMSASFSST